MTSNNNGYFAKHAKSSAVLVSLGIHVILIILAFSFVAVTVIQKKETAFEAKTINRPKMPLRKLQVPVKVKKIQQPKLRKTIVVQPKLDKSMPDIKMPEMVGVKGGLGGAAGGMGAADGIGFAMPEFELFGVKGKGEKVFIALDSDPRIMRDEVGGMRAYTIIKDEVDEIISGLPPTTLFNIAVFEHDRAFALFPSMVSANSANVAKAKAWLDPLNQVKAGMGAEEYGVKTLPPGGIAINAAKYRGKYGKVKGGAHWYPPTALAMEQQADAVFILSGWWGHQSHATDKKAPGGWSDSEREKWYAKLEEAKERLKKENAERLARGEAPRVLGEGGEIVNAYFPGSGYIPYEYIQYNYTGRDFAEALHLCRQEYAPKMARRGGLSKKDNFSINVIYFASEDTGIPEHEENQFKQLVQSCNGSLRVLDGLEAIQSSAF